MNKFQACIHRLVPAIAVLFVAIGGWLTFAPSFHPVSPAAGSTGQSESVTVSVSAPSRTITRPIELVRVGDRVLGQNPDRAEVSTGEAEPDETWVAVDVYQAKPGGGHFYATLLRSPQWVTAHIRGKVVELDREELGAVGRAEVLTVDPAPPIQPGTGQVVTGTFRHQSGGELVRVRVAGESITCTDGHRFWNETAAAFVHAKDLRAGDMVRTRAAGLVAVETVEPAGPAGWVYNLEVAGEHVYEVGNDGILVHNDGCVAFRSLSREDILSIASGNGVLPKGNAATNNALHAYITQDRPSAFVATFGKFKALWDKKNYIEISTATPGYRSGANLAGDKNLMKLFVGKRDTDRFSDGHGVVKGGIPNGAIKKLVVDGKEVDVKEASALSALLQALGSN